MQDTADFTGNPELKAAATADYQAMAAKLKAAEKDLQTFCKATGQDRDRFREQVLGFSRSEAQRAVQAAKKAKSGLTSGAKGGTIKKTSGALNPISKRADEHAKRYYASVRKMKTDVSKISKNTGFSEELIESIKNFIFMEKHDLGDRVDYFDPDYKMAESWQRLIDGKNIQHHDLTLLKHEKMERELMLQGYTQDEAHRITSMKYNYGKEAEEYYDKIEKHSKK